jgi:hypothetical protein
MSKSRTSASDEIKKVAHAHSLWTLVVTSMALFLFASLLPLVSLLFSRKRLPWLPYFVL